MGKMTPAELEQLKRDVSLLNVAQSQRRELKRQGKDYVTLCPFHTEKTPSCVISPAKNLYHCFGCGAAGSVLDWLQQTERLTFPQTLVRLRELAGTSSVAATVASSSSPPAVPPTLADLDDDGQALLNQVIDFYHQQLLAWPEAQEWLVSRGLNHPELMSHFRLGFAGAHGIAGALPSSQSKAGRRLRERLVDVGVLRETTRQDHFRGCVVMPVIGWAESANVANRGRVLQLYGRRTQPDYKIIKGNPKHLYLSSPLVGVWNEAALKASSEVILCEALIDAMTFWCAGFRNVIAAYGVNGFTAEHRAALQYHGVKRVLIAFDRDEAGDRGAEAVAGELLEVGIDAWRVRFPQGLDANEYALKSGNPERALGLSLEQAQRLGAALEHDTASAETPSSLAAPAVSHTEAVAGEVTASGELLMHCGPRVWRVRGWQKNSVPDVMKVNVQVRDESTGAFHVDQLDMYHAKQRQSYINVATVELGCETSVIKRECGRLLLLLEQKQDEARQAVEQATPAAVALSAEDEAAALALLKDGALATRIVDDLATCGVVGESSNLLTGYLAATSRKLDKPLAVLIQSSSAAGKSSLMDAVLGLMPEEERIQYSAMTGQSLYYLGETSLQHKILAIAEEEGVRQAAYALKLLQSDGELKIASTGKNEQSGELVTREYKVQGPVMLMLTTTAIDVDEELLNRCLVLTVNESREQTQAIHAMQRHGQTLEGLLAANEKGYLTRLHQNAQRLLRPLRVVNPYAHQLTFLSDKTRTRRDHMKYLTLIQSIALLHQYQREVKRVQHRGEWLEYIEVERSDIELANRLAHEVLGRTLDEMPPQTRKLLLLIQDMVKGMAARQGCQSAEVRFTRRDIRGYTHWSDNQLKVHCLRLSEMEYLLLHGGSRGHLLQYELLWDGQNGDENHLCGLLDVDEHAGSKCKLDSEESKLVPSCSQVGARLEGDKAALTEAEPGLAADVVGVEPNAVIKVKNKRAASPSPTMNVVNGGSECKLDSEESKLVPSCPQVGAKLEGEKVASTEAGQGLAADEVGVEPNAVIKGNKKSPATAPGQQGREQEVLNGAER
ncbi:CHC2 zinc finger domain-containing protein [Serratia sp. UGAL515B_01]|uniref:CHC2 zinc finger domain-containing protein n=1 Tax=Serratia sp. UGAL515B_01 TaxID=2986763 RepID=UPI002955203E|nr:CHC2 zinc finger domain-containing protein [Serratia sp. UGAL515B_01]WON75607.1 CHC2 zinc finger domain-containing protein [Serratia sp. UGAL515B_01]